MICKTTATLLLDRSYHSKGRRKVIAGDRSLADWDDPIIRGGRHSGLVPLSHLAVSSVRGIMPLIYVNLIGAVV